MANLASLAAAAQGMSAVAGAGNAYAQYNANIGQGAYQASVLNQNAMMADMQAQQATKAAEYAAGTRGEQAADVIGKQRATIAGGAVNVNTGSAAKVQDDTARAAALDEAQIMKNAALQRWGYNVDAINSRNQADMARRNGRFAGNSSLISGGAQFARDAVMTNYYAKGGGGRI